MSTLWLLERIAGGRSLSAIAWARSLAVEQSLYFREEIAVLLDSISCSLADWLPEMVLSARTL